MCHDASIWQKARMKTLVLLCLIICSQVAFSKDSSFLSTYPSELRLAWLCYTNGNYSNSVIHYQTAIQAAPESLDARLGCLLPMLALQRFAEAESSAKQVLKRYPANYYANLRLAYALRMQGKYEQAELVLNRALALRPTDVSLLLELALVKLARKQNATAKGLFLDVLTLAPDNAVALEQLALPQLLGDPRDVPLAQPWSLSLGLRPLDSTRKISVEAAPYVAYLDYHGTASKDHANLAGIYTAFGYGLEHLVEAEADYIQKFYRGYPSLSQWDFTLAYDNYSIPHLKLRAGGHYVAGEDRYTDEGWVVFGGAEYYVLNRWAVGVDGYFTQYPKFQTHLEVVQIVPHFGVTFWHGENFSWNNDVRGYWIRPNQDYLQQRDFYSIEDKLSLNWRRWTFSAFGWTGQQVFAVRDNGFALYNLGEEHKAGYGLEVRYIFSEHFALTLRANREEFRDIASTPNASSDMYMAMLNVYF